MTGEPASNTCIELVAELGISEAEALKTELIEALDSGRDICVRASNVRRIGTSALQLLIAFLREAQLNGHQVSWDGVSDALRDAARLSDLLTALGLDAQSAN